MKPADSQSLLLSLHLLIGGEDGERNARRIIEHVLAKAGTGHIGYLRYVFTVVDGPTRPTAEDEMTSEAECVIVADNDVRADWTPKAA